MSIKAKVEETLEKLNKLRPLALGDKVIHKATGLCGTVEAVESFDTVGGQIIGVALLNGRHIRGLRREEFALHTPGLEQIREQGVKLVEAASEIQRESIKLTGPISDRSILNELE